MNLPAFPFLVGCSSHLCCVEQIGRNLAELRISFFSITREIGFKDSMLHLFKLGYDELYFSAFLGHTWSKELISGKKMTILPFQVLIILNFKDLVVLPDYEQPNFCKRNQAKLRISGPGPGWSGRTVSLCGLSSRLLRRLFSACSVRQWILCKFETKYN